MNLSKHVLTPYKSFNKNRGRQFPFTGYVRHSSIAIKGQQIFNNRKFCLVSSMRSEREVSHSGGSEKISFIVRDIGRLIRNKNPLMTDVYCISFFVQVYLCRNNLKFVRNSVSVHCYIQNFIVILEEFFTKLLATLALWQGDSNSPNVCSCACRKR